MDDELLYPLNSETFEGVIDINAATDDLSIDQKEPLIKKRKKKN